ncbi:MAG TPA: tRNA 2-thiouridine(34) synthase MnmA [bacterium]|nr:tRNA 2-thiouridine(34) synthase MnmA [bacterium]
MARLRVAVAMSGGTDSAYAALWCRRRGYDPVGVTLWLTDMPTEPPGIALARAMAERLGIPHQVIDARAEFRTAVTEYSVAEYARLRTPNPCARCNPTTKFAVMLRAARDLGATKLATGHYARVGHAGGRWLIRRGRDPKKEQSYFLFALAQEQLAHTLFPLGGIDKHTVRVRLHEAGLTVPADESQEVCFIPRDCGVAAWLRARGINDQPGPIIGADGREVGRHAGLAGFTIGQREGIRVPAAYPLYVLGFDRARNALLVGPNEALMQREMTVTGLNLVALPAWPDRFRARVQVRYRATPAPALLVREGADRLRVRFDAPQRGLTPGQCAVVYRRSTVLGGGWIDAVAR